VTPNTGYTASVGGTCGGSLSGTTYTTSAITGACTVTASFTPNTYTVTASAGSNGSISPATRTVSHGSTTTFEVTANSGYVVSSVTGTCGGSLAGTTYTTSAITGACTVVASFVVNNVTLAVAKSGTGTGTVTGNGINCGSTCSVTLAPTTNVTLTAAKDSNSKFAGWSGDCSGTGTCVFSPINTNRSVTAKFDACYYATVYAHYTAGRAVYDMMSGYNAKGSNDSLGWTILTNVYLQETSSGYWIKVANCN
jgi:hypothetical protein